MDAPDDEEREILALMLRLYDGEANAPAALARMVEILRGQSARLDELFDLFQSLVAERRAGVDYSEAIARAGQRAEAAAERMARDEVQARSDLRCLLDTRGAKARRRLIRKSRSRFRAPQLVEGLLAEACTARRRDPREAVHLLELALEVAARVDGETYGSPIPEQLVTRVEAHRANALRVACELVSADTLWWTVNERLRQYPPTDPQEEAEFLSLEASLRIDQRRFEEAEGLLEAAEAIYRRLGERVGVAKTLMKRGHAAFVAGEPGASLELHKQALAECNPAESPRLARRLHHDVAICLVELDEPEGAAAHLAAHGTLFDRIDDKGDRIRYSWLEGLIERRLGHELEARKWLQAARNDYLDLRLGYDAALVSLDLADLHLDLGRTREVHRLAESMVRIFEAQDVHREAMAALLLFQRTAQADALTPAFVAALRSYLRQARHDPSYRFDPQEVATDS